MRRDPLEDVSRETRQALEAYLDLLIKWNRAINLIGRATRGEIWHRHVLDCAQLVRRCPSTQVWADLGSGGGLPGLVIGILSEQHVRVTCIEADGRKAEFQRTVVRELGLQVEVVNQRIEAAPPAGAEIVTARALAPLPQLLGYAERHLAPSGQALLMKGATWREEVEAAREKWHFSLEALPSITNPDAVILEIGELRRA